MKVTGPLGRDIRDLVMDCMNRHLTSFEDVAAVIQDVFFKHYHVKIPTPADAFRRHVQSLRDGLVKAGIVKDHTRFSPEVKEQVIKQILEKETKHYEQFGARHVVEIDGISQYNFEFWRTVVDFGDMNFQLGKFVEAETHYQEALSLFEMQTKADDEAYVSGKREILSRLAGLYKTVGNHERWAQYLEKIRDLS